MTKYSNNKEFLKHSIVKRRSKRKKTKQNKKFLQVFHSVNPADESGVGVWIGIYQLKSQTRRANTQMIHILHTYRTPSQSPPLHNQLSWTLLHATIFELLHATESLHKPDLNLRENGHLSFFISHTTVSLNEGQGHPNWYQSLVVSIIIPSFKEKNL